MKGIATGSVSVAAIQEGLQRTHTVGVRLRLASGRSVRVWFCKKAINRFAIHATGKALLHMRWGEASETWAAAMSLISIPTKRSFSCIYSGLVVPLESRTQVDRLRSLCDLRAAIKVGHFVMGCPTSSVGTVDPGVKQSCHVLGRPCKGNSSEGLGREVQQ